MPPTAHAVDAHEGDWFYVSTPLTHLNGSAEELIEGIRRVVDEAGRMPLFSPETSGATSPRTQVDEMLRFALACIIDISTDSQEVGADLGCALATGRPIVALKHEAAGTGESLVAAVTAPGRGRVIRYGDVTQCIVELRTTLEDPDWWRLVADAVSQDVH